MMWRNDFSLVNDEHTVNHASKREKMTKIKVNEAGIMHESAVFHLFQIGFKGKKMVKN